MPTDFLVVMLAWHIEKAHLFGSSIVWQRHGTCWRTCEQVDSRFLSSSWGFFLGFFWMQSNISAQDFEAFTASATLQR